MATLNDIIENNHWDKSVVISVPSHRFFIYLVLAVVKTVGYTTRLLLISVADQTALSLSASAAHV